MHGLPCFQSGLPTQKRGMFILGGGLVEANRFILQQIIEASSFEQILIVTSLHPAMHTILEYGPGEHEDGKAFYFYKELINEWSDGVGFMHKHFAHHYLTHHQFYFQRAQVNFMYLPLVAAPIIPNLFFLPGHHEFFPLLPSDLQSLYELNQVRIFNHMHKSLSIS
jgi:hypothetical protein